MSSSETPAEGSPAAVAARPGTSPAAPSELLSDLSISKLHKSSSQPELQDDNRRLPPKLPGLQTANLQLQHSSSGGHGWTPHASIPSSPTAASEYSIPSTHGSTSSAIPFSHIAHQRKQQEREAALQDAASTLIHDTAAAFDLRMQSYGLDISTLQELNEAAAQQYSGTAEIAAALGQFVADLQQRQAAAKEALSMLPQLDRQLELLSTAVSQLDKRSRQLESKLGLKPLSGGGVGGGGGSSSSSSAYGYLASGVSQLTAVGVSTAAAASLGCLGGTSSTDTSS